MTRILFFLLIWNGDAEGAVIPQVSREACAASVQLVIDQRKPDVEASCLELQVTFERRGAIQ